MKNARNKVIEGAVMAENMLRARGARGKDFGEMVRDLAARSGMPKRVLDRCLAANRVRDRLMRVAAVPAGIEVYVWWTGIEALMNWLDAQPLELPGSQPGVQTAERNPVVRKTARIQPWMIIAAAMLLVSLVALSFHASKLPPAGLSGSVHPWAPSLHDIHPQ